MKNQTLYLECYSGISGDMTVAALLDLGADQTVLLEGLKSLTVDGYKVVIGRRTKSSIDACDFNVILEDPLLDYGEHHHDHQHTSEHHHDHQHSYEDNVSEEHSHNHSVSHISASLHHLQPKLAVPLRIGHHDHRNLYEINAIIESSSISQNAKELAKKIFYIVAVAEAKAHGKPIEEIHFHEVGAVDSIVDIVATAICIDNLKIKDVIVSELYEGTGQITCQHGILPIPVPAVSNIVTAHQLPLHITSVKGELVTPTGAAIAAALRTKDALPKDMKILKIGLGAGKRNYANASGILRAMLIDDTSDAEKSSLEKFILTKSDAVNSNAVNSDAAPSDKTDPADRTDNVWVLEANIDDCTGEALAIAMELLFENGAKDVYYTPIYMKKNRPAYLLGIICSEDRIKQMEEIIFTNTTTIGIRRHKALRTTLFRKIITVSTPYGTALAKVCSYEQRNFIYPECDSVKKLCKENNKDYLTLYRLVQTLAENQIFKDMLNQ